MTLRAVTALALLAVGTSARAAVPVSLAEWSPADREVAADGPLALWRFEDAAGATGSVATVFAAAAPADTDDPAPAFAATSRRDGAPVNGEPGPQPPRHPDFAAVNRAALFGGGRGFFALGAADTPEFARFRFAAGDAITIEAWVFPFEMAEGRQAYVIGKGRTGRRGQPAENQNWALRLVGRKGQAVPGFLFRGTDGEYHRWAATSGFEAGSGWHHVAVSYTFGRRDSIAAYVDGRPVPGTWDLGGATDAGPVSDDDEVWIGSSQGGGAGSTFPGMLDSVAVFRSVVPAPRIASRYRVDDAVPAFVEPVLAPVPDGRVLFEVLEGVPDGGGFVFAPRDPTERFTADVFAFHRLPQRYDAEGLRADRTNPSIVRGRTMVTLPSGPSRITVRARGAARIMLDGRTLGEIPAPSQRTDGHEKMFMPDRSGPAGIRFVQPGDRQATFDVEGDGGRHELRVEVRVGGRGRRPETGEFSVSMGPPGEVPLIVAATGDGVPLTDSGWAALATRLEADLLRGDTAARRSAAAAQNAAWKARHDAARAYVAALPPLHPPALDAAPAAYRDSIRGPVDRFVNARLLKTAEPPPVPVDDAAFVRRLSLDVRGVIPSAGEVESFLADPRPDRRERLVDAFLADPRWADHWVGYWQDVLAENPNLVNPTLNNTGPFRFWIHDSFLDRKAMDRFATELIRMRGSTHFGGPAGFALATENDVPMAAKAHVLGRAFMAVEMNCARCHDAPNHPVLQEDLFALAALLGREPQKVPATSSVPGGPDRLANLAITVSLEPGSVVQPAWPFADIASPEAVGAAPLGAGDSRELAAALITSPHNRRFAPVLVNRLWQRFFGVGIVPDLDDWNSAAPSDPELLDWLARELVSHDYALEHVARLILVSSAYGAARAPRRMTAEQLVDSVLAACGKPFDVEPMNIDIDTSRETKLSLNLGLPERAWQFTGLGNERDRPSLSLPFAQQVVTVLEAFGWRGERQNPLSARESDPTALQPAIVANGVFVKRATQFSDGSAFTALARVDQPVEAFVDGLCLRILSRFPTAAERRACVAVLSAGYADRLTEGVAPPPLERPVGVSWSNHLSDEANEAKLRLAEIAAAGDPPTGRLAADWRERAEDVAWALYNLPEFVFVP